MDRKVDDLLRTYLMPADEPGNAIKMNIFEQLNKEDKIKRNDIRTIFAFKMDVNSLTAKHKIGGLRKRMATVLTLLVCFLALSAFAYNKFSDIAGDELALNASYKGDGVFEIHITNLSDKDLRLQEQIKLMQWSTGEEVEGDAEKILFENLKIDAHTEETIIIDISQGYEIAVLEEPLPAGDWYYFVLTNNNFAFGQDWMCSIDFDENAPETMNYEVVNTVKEEVVYPVILRFEEWTWPTVSEDISMPYGAQENGAFSDHINIVGKEGDEVYAVSEGVVTELGFESTCGNYVVIDLGDGISVKYGHLKDILVKEGEAVEKGQEIAGLGQTGMATGPNLLLAVYIEGETVNPLEEYN